MIWIAITSIVALSLLSLLTSRLLSAGTRALWLGGSAATALFLLAGVVAVCTLILRMPSDHEHLGTRVTGSASAAKFLEVSAQKQQRQHIDAERPIYIPTGVFVQSIEFTTANNVILTGYVWQKYAHSDPENISRGFVLPEAESAEISEAYSRPHEDGTVIGWHFRATLRQIFDYSAFPLDTQNVWIRIWHQDFDRNVILTPDFPSYDYTNPVDLPRLEEDNFVLPGWNVVETFFSFRENSHNANFGIEDYVGQLDFPELYFNIALARRFVDPFISHIVPSIAIVIMLFAVLIYGTKSKEEAAKLGFDASTVLSISAAFFFTVLIGHVNLRSGLASERVAYLEYFYLIMYLAILSVAINSLLFTSQRESVILRRVIYSKDNLWPKLFYWPMIMGLLFVITVFVFY